MKTIQTAVATRANTSEQDPLTFYSEASDLQFPPGTWPDVIATVLGNGRPFRYSHRDEVSEDNYIYIYVQPGTGAKLNIFND